VRCARGSKTHCFVCSGVNAYFSLGGGNFFPSKGGDQASPRPEGPRARVRFLGEGQRGPPHQLGGLVSAVSSPSWGSSDLVQLETSKFTTKMPYNV